MSKRRKKVLIAIGLFAFFLFLSLLGILFYVHTNHAGRQIMGQVNARIPGDIMFKDYEPALHKGKIELGNILVKDPEGYMVAGIDRLVIQVSWLQLLYRNIMVDAVLVKNPQVNIIVDSDGNISLVRAFVIPEVKEDILPEKIDEKTPFFNLILNKFSLENGLFFFENAQKGIRANLEGIQLSSSGNLEKQIWQLDLSADKGFLKTPQGQADLEMLKLSGAIEEDRVSKLNFDIKTPSSSLSIVASAREIFSEPWLDLALDFGIHLPEVHEAFFPQTPYTGNLTGKLAAKGNVSNPEILLETVYSGGELAGLNIDHITIQAVLQDRLFDLSPVQIEFPTGHAAAQVTANLKKVFPKGFLSPPESFEQLSYNIEMTVSNLDLEKALGEDFEGKGRLEGIILAKGKGISSEEAVADIQIDLEGFDITTAAITPIDLIIKAAASLKNGKAIVEDLKVKAGPAEIQADAYFHMISREIEANIRASSTDIKATLNPLGIEGAHGAFNLEAKATGTLEKPSVDLFFESDEIYFENFHLGNIDVRATLFEGVLSIQKAAINNRDSELELSGTVGILERTGLKLHDDPPVNLELKAEPLYLEHFVNQMSAKISMNAQIEGTLKNPTGNYKIQAEKIDTGIQKLESFLVKGDLKDNKLYFEPLQILFAPGQSIEGSGWICTDKNFSLLMASEGIDLNKIDKVREENIADAMLVMDISGWGNLENPQIQGIVSLKDLVVNQQDLGTARINIQLADYQAQLEGRLNFDFSAAYHLKNQNFNIDVHFDDTNLSPYFDLAGLEDFSGKISATLEASGNTEEIKQARASGQISVLNIFMKEKELLHAENFEAIFKNQQLLMPDLNLRLFDSGNLRIEASVALEGSVNVKADGNIPLEGLAMVTQSLPDITGGVQISATVDGTTHNPDIHGEFIFDQIGFTIPELYQKLHGLSGRIAITPKAVNIEKLKGNLDTGGFELNGKVGLKDFYPQQIELELAARSVPLSVPDTLNVLLQADMSLSGTPDKALLAGELLVLEGVYYKDVNINLVDGITQRRRPVAPKMAEKPHPLLENLNLDIAIKRRNPFWVDNNLASLNINPDLRIAGTASQPLIEGRTTIESGTVTFQKKTFTVQKGIIDFVNPYELEPSVDIESAVKIRKWTITLTIRGTPENLLLTLKSDPPEEDGDIVSLLVLGRTTRELIRGEGGSSRSSEQMVAELVASTFGEDIKKMTGLDFLEVETDNESNDESEGVKVTVGKQLSERLMVKYSADSRTGEMIQRAISEYKLLENIILSAFQDTGGIFGGEIQYRLEFR